MSNAARWHPRELHTMVVVIDCLEKAREVHILQEDVEKRPPARLHSREVDGAERGQRYALSRRWFFFFFFESN